MSAPDLELIAALEAAGCTVRGTSVVCAFHGDRHASGSIYVGNDARWRYKCHGCDAAGDAADIIARHTGRPLAEVLAARNGSTLPPPPAKRGQSFATLAELAATVYRQQPEAVYRYETVEEHDHLAVLRLPGKQFRQAKWTPDGWQSGGVGEPFPLYRKPALAGDASGVVAVTEGEKDADALAALGILATTAPMGADAITCPPDKDGKPGKVDWSPLAGRSVVLFGDDDDPGRNHMARVARCLGRLIPSPVLSMVRAEDRHGCKDAADLIAAHGAEAARQAIAQAVPCCVAEDAPATPSFDLRSFADTQPAALTWIWDGVIPCGMLSMVAGKQGLGKSYMLCDLAARVSTGSPMPDGKPQQPGNVLMLVREDDASLVLLPRLISAGADLTRITWSMFHNTDTHAPMDLTQHIDELARTVTACQFSMIVVDTFASFAPTGTDVNAGQSVRGVLDPLARLARQTGAAVMVVAHVRKAGQGEGDAMDAISGSAQMTAGVRVACILDAGQAEGERWFRTVKSNLGRCDGPGWTWRFQQPSQTLGNVSDNTVPKIVWTVAGESYRDADADRRAGRVTVDPGELLNAVLAAVAKRPLTVKAATAATWNALRRRFPGIRKGDVEMDVENLAADPGSTLEAGKGPRGARLIGLPGTIPEQPEDKARRLAKPGMTVGELAKVAGCRRESANAILGELRP